MLHQFVHSFVHIALPITLTCLSVFIISYTVSIQKITTPDLSKVVQLIVNVLEDWSLQPGTEYITFWIKGKTALTMWVGGGSKLHGNYSFMQLICLTDFFP